MAQCKKCGTALGDAQASSKSRKRLLITVTTLVAAVLVMSLSLLAVSCGGDAATGPEKAVQTFFAAMEEKNIDKFMEIVDPATFQDATDAGLSMDALKAMLAEEMFTYDSMNFSDLKMETTSTGEDTATVRVTGGTVTMVTDGQSETKSVLESDTPVELQLLQKDGKWYVDINSMQ
jgi:hypothetical protein